MLFLLLPLVLVALGGGLYGLNRAIKYSEVNGRIKRRKNRSAKEELDEQNVELLRRQINNEATEIKENNMLYDMAGQIIEQMKKEGKDIP